MQTVKFLFQRRFNVSDLRPQAPKIKKEFRGFFKLHSGGSLQKTVPVEGEYALVADEGARVKDVHLDNARTMIRRIIKPYKGSKFFISYLPTLPVTGKGAAQRMGKGKGAIDFFALWVSPGQTLMEVSGVSKEVADKALTAASHCFGIRTKIIRFDPEITGGDRTPPQVVPHFIKKRLEQAEFARALKA